MHTEHKPKFGYSNFTGGKLEINEAITNQLTNNMINIQLLRNNMEMESLSVDYLLTYLNIL